MALVIGTDSTAKVNNFEWDGEIYYVSIWRQHNYSVSNWKQEMQHLIHANRQAQQVTNLYLPYAV